jgi:hypothetical protein
MPGLRPGLHPLKPRMRIFVPDPATLGLLALGGLLALRRAKNR